MEVKKYKVLFADDEYWTREKVRRIIPWEKYSLEFLEPAKDGEEVIRRMEEDKPDILITDINMPYINGVELLQRIQALYPEVITFVISGYDDFNYVKESFMAGSINYLMKPVGKIDLVNALSQALRIIGERHEKKEAEKKQKTELMKISSFIQDREFSQFLDTKATPVKLNNVMNNHMEFVGASLILVKIHNLQELIQLYEHDMNLLSFSVKQRLYEVCGQKNIIIFNHIYRSNEFLIVAEMDEAKVHQLAYRIQKDISSATKSPVTIIESEHKYSMENLSEAYVQDISRMMLRSYANENIFLNASAACSMEKKSIANRMDENHIRDMQRYAKSANAQEMKNLLFQEIGLKKCGTEKWTYLEVRQVVRRFANHLLEEYAKSAKVDHLMETQSMLEAADKAVDLMDVDVLCDTLSEIIDFFLNAVPDEAPDSIRSGILKAVSFVDEHFQENITLSVLAERFHVESSYFSRMFRKETGENLMLYICRKRMQKAVEYMNETDKSLTEIAFMVGYDDYTYFNKVFRKMMGQSPREYRQMLQTKEADVQS